MWPNVFVFDLFSRQCLRSDHCSYTSIKAKNIFYNGEWSKIGNILLQQLQTKLVILICLFISFSEQERMQTTPLTTYFDHFQLHLLPLRLSPLNHRQLRAHWLSGSSWWFYCWMLLRMGFWLIFQLLRDPFPTFQETGIKTFRWKLNYISEPLNKKFKDPWNDLPVWQQNRLCLEFLQPARPTSSNMRVWPIDGKTCTFITYWGSITSCGILLTSLSVYQPTWSMKMRPCFSEEEVSTSRTFITKKDPATKWCSHTWITSNHWWIRSAAGTWYSSISWIFSFGFLCTLSSKSS